MERTLVKVHTSFIGSTGYNVHAKNLCRALSEFHDVQIRNYTVGRTWKGFSDEPHNLEPGITNLDKKLLVEQNLSTSEGFIDLPIYINYPNLGTAQIHLVLNDLWHPFFYNHYDGVKIAYNVWETTRWPDDFFEILKKYDQFWVPSEWHKQCAIDQGYPSSKIHVVPEGVDPSKFKPINHRLDDLPFRFLIVGRWEYRKSTKEMILAFCEEFKDDLNVELHLLVDNPFANDELGSTENRLANYGILDEKIKVLHSLTDGEYVSLLHTSHVFLSCSRGEGWNLPLIEAMACGVPSIYSDWGAQLEFAKNKGIAVKVVSEKSASFGSEENWIKYAPGNLCEPDFNDFRRAMRDAFNNFSYYKEKAVADSVKIREDFSWKKCANRAAQLISRISKKTDQMDWKWVTCGDQNYLPLIESLAKSLAEFSTRKLIVYGVNCEPNIQLENVINRTLNVEIKSVHEKWYWKQIACLQSIKEEGDNFIWIDSDVIVNYNIDTIEKEFSRLTDYPLSDIHYLQEHIYYSTDANGRNICQTFGSNLAKLHGVNRFTPFAHVCLFIYNRNCEWWFNEILTNYVSIPEEEYRTLNPWNDEGIDNLLRWKYNKRDHLPLSNFDVSSYLGSRLGNFGDSLSFFLRFMDEEGPKNFGDLYGFQQVPLDKSSVLYFHGNKDPNTADLMLAVIKMKRDNSFFDSEYFYVAPYSLKNLGKIKGLPGSTMSIAQSYGWDFAIYHEIFNLNDYEWSNWVKICPGDTVVDLGANLGIFTRFAYQSGATKILSFEPDRRYFEVLQKNAPPSALLFRSAISNQLGKILFTEAEHLGGSNVLIDSSSSLTQYEVETYTVDHLFSAGYVESIDFLKVDIEGAEVLAFAGISDVNLKKIKKIAMEWHHAHFKWDDALRLNFIIRLNQLGFNSMILNTATNDLQMIYFWQ